MQQLTIQTNSREQLIDITRHVQERITSEGWNNGALLLYCPHTTGAVTINEGADPDVARDMTVAMRRIVPFSGDYRHAEGNSDAHIKSSMFGCDQMVIVENGRLCLGTWQVIYFCEFDGPRKRTLWATFLPS